MRRGEREACACRFFLEVVSGTVFSSRGDGKGTVFDAPIAPSPMTDAPRMAVLGSLFLPTEKNYTRKGSGGGTKF